jgi:cyclophilin family peptidyl-prolyl cis-trans isomerase/HEAT repeat protein
VRAAILAAEDARAARTEQLDLLIVSARTPHPGVQRLAVRALGRLERPEVARYITPLLASPVAEVRADAAVALGQAAQGLRSPREEGGDAPAFASALLARLAAEADPGVAGILCDTLGRLPYDDADTMRRVEAALGEAVGRALKLHGVTGDWTPLALGATKGLEALFRLNAKQRGPSPATVRLLKERVASPFSMLPAASPRERLRPQPVRDEASTLEAFARNARLRVRRFALAALMPAKQADLRTIREALDPGPTSDSPDYDPQLHRLAILAIGSHEPAEADRAAVLDLLQPGQRDPDIVLYEKLRELSRWRDTIGCGSLVRAAESTLPHVRLLALDLLGTPCRNDEGVPVLERALETLSDIGERVARPAFGSVVRNSAAWHEAARALVSLAKVAPDAAAKALPSFAAHRAWQTRMYAARAAAVLRRTDALEELVRDEHDNVRDAALAALVELEGHGADGLSIESLERDDYQLLRTAARLLQGSPARARAVRPLAAALRRITAGQRDTSRDTRVALLERLEELGSAEDAALVTDLLEDADPAIAARAAGVLRTWTGTAHEPKPQRRPAPPPPSVEELDRIDALQAIVTMRGGGNGAGNRTFVLRLLPYHAPLTVTRFVRLATAGYYNGLTFHRIVPNFVIQGGSPGANEYMGDGPYMRDEVGAVPHLRGTVGISTRGRDTGDAQIFVNLVDNPRLDANYTVFAEVADGFEVVAGIIEGDVIEAIELINARPGRRP